MKEESRRRTCAVQLVQSQGTHVVFFINTVTLGHVSIRVVPMSADTHPTPVRCATGNTVHKHCQTLRWTLEHSASVVTAKHANRHTTTPLSVHFISVTQGTECYRCIQQDTDMC
jgi:hypothetical protein